MKLTEAANALKELGHPTRLGIYRELVKAGHAGLPVGEIQKRLSIPSSTLSHHIAALLSVDLVRQERQGRILCCQPCYERLEALLAFLTEECCSGTVSSTTATHSQKCSEEENDK